MITPDYSTEAAPQTRERLIQTMIHLLQTRGLHGAGLSELLALAQAPKGVLYHHFPGGKTALAVAAVEATVAWSCNKLDEYLGDGADVGQALGMWIERAQRGLHGSGFERGCPLAAVALESTPADTELRAALAAAFQAIRERLALGLQRNGQTPAAAQGLAALIVATYEGGLLQARVANDTAPMAQATAALLALLKEKEQK
ncbi:TetR/AcrR family transcriptional regulator [Massilia sp. BJB1822]|uniref:TetR/AcrR family transcriptional regulator n=1 Tax=Massilia sp. BJB1822 TaxID=2744470 RepID=UPI001E4FC00F|nr:TetR/AcrR family transcriptional regulator [Massilia sp. BJB1822]